ncbi:MAG: D-alanyl-D-alanine carboxypeptidase [Clostridia bacterium]|nr:D-alanyl-D-alanine carboxypeptidase [Clostridia bacterium]
MKLKNKLIIMIFIFFLFINIFSLSYAETSSGNTDSNSSSDEATSTNQLHLYSDAAILIDSVSGKVLCGKNENVRMFPASTTKVLTAIIALENCDLSEKMTASYNAVMSIPVGYSNAAIQPGETLSFQELLDVFLVHSANEAGFIIAEHISGSVENFSVLMNQKAQELGCVNSNFTNPSGIHDENHYSTAYDLAIITKYCMENETFRNIISKKSCKVAATDKYQERFFSNTNDLINPKSKYYYEYSIGGKTGFSTPAKNCLISASVKDNLELISVILHAQSTENGESARYVDSINLFDYGFSNFKIQDIASKNSVVEETSILNGTKNTRNLPLILKDSIRGITPSDFELSDLNYKIELNDNLVAPIAEGDVVGKITYSIDGIDYSSDLLASHNVEDSNLIVIIGQIVLAFIVLIILKKMLSKNMK